MRSARQSLRATLALARVALPAVFAASQMQGCATAPVRVADVTDYVAPSHDTGLLRSSEVRDLDGAWRQLMAGDASGAEKRFRRLRAARPQAAAPETGLGYALLSRGKPDLAEAAFLAVISRHPRYVPALAGAGTVFRRRGDAETAVELFRRAADAGGASVPALVRRRLGEAKLEVMEARVGAGRHAIEEGREDRAIEEYSRLLRVVPELAGVRLELAQLLAKSGNTDGAVEVLATDPGDDRLVLLRLAGLYLETARPSDALRVAEKALERDPRDDEARRLKARAQNEIEVAGMPEEYRRILVAARITRADLAALLSVKVARLSSLRGREPSVATDISGSWARAHILQILSLGIMRVYPNHTFQPAGLVRRSDMAQALARALDLVGAPARALPALVDVSPANLYYEDAARAVAEGLMDVTPTGSFEPWRTVSGPEAAAVVEALDRLLRPAPNGKKSSR
jgi:tetratricopeptide (TPR) repeat protein